MSTIWKFPLVMREDQEIELPYGSIFLTAQTQRGMGSEVPTIWAQVNPESPIVKHKVKLCMTGREGPPEGWVYVGTCMLHEDNLVLHIYVEPTKIQ